MRFWPESAARGRAIRRSRRGWCVDCIGLLELHFFLRQFGELNTQGAVFGGVAGIDDGFAFGAEEFEQGSGVIHFGGGDKGFGGGFGSGKRVWAVRGQAANRQSATRSA